MVPYARNPFFTSREEVLTRLHETLHTTTRAALVQPQGLSGLGGIGKTQTAIEYAYRYQQEYRAVLWVGGDSREILIASFVALAVALELPERDERDQNRVLEAVQRWLRLHADWLLIIDNVEELSAVSDVLPTAYRGHILLTTRSRVLGSLAQGITIEKMLPEAGALLLLRRSGMIDRQALLSATTREVREQAVTVAQMLDGLPLALDQAGAYIREIGCSLSEYLALYRTRRTRLLRRRGTSGEDHPEAVATTWSLSFEKVRQENPAAAELLRFCAFLYPDGIPEELITEGAPFLSKALRAVATDPFRLNMAVRALLRFSLLQRYSSTRTFGVHRLVQVVLRDRMQRSTQQRWAERTIRAVNQAFPRVEFEIWSRCERYLPHARVCADLIGEWKLESPEAARLLHETGYYMEERAQYTHAEQLLRQSRDLYEHLLGLEHPDVANCLNSLAELYRAQSRYAEAEPLYRRALALREQSLSPDHLEVAQSLNNLAALYCNQGRYGEAEPLYQKALEMRTRALGPEHHQVAFTLTNLAALYYMQGRYGEAEPLYVQALGISERHLGPEHLDLVINLNNLALLYHAQSRYEEAGLLLQRALHIREHVLGPEHPDVATTLTNLAGLSRILGKYSLVEEYYLRALHIYEQAFGVEHPNVVLALNGLAIHYLLQKQYERAEPLYLQAIDICKQIGRSEHTDMAVNLSGLARLYYHQGDYLRSEELYLQALALYERMLGSAHRDVATCLGNLGMLYNQLGRDEQAEAALKRALEILLQVLGPDHPDAIQNMNNLAVSYYNQGKFAAAERLYQEALVKQQKVLGTEHPEIVRTITRLAMLYEAQVRYAQAEEFYQLAVALYERIYTPGHLTVAQALENYAAFLQRRTGKGKAAKVRARAQAIRTTLGMQKEDQT
jgi:tetratricopeptide (TPR) repeat protein